MKFTNAIAAYPTENVQTPVVLVSNPIGCSSSSIAVTIIPEDRTVNAYTHIELSRIIKSNAAPREMAVTVNVFAVELLVVYVVANDPTSPRTYAKVWKIARFKEFLLD